MQFSVQNGVNVSAELAAANDYPHIRLFTVGLGTFSVVPLGQLQTVYQAWTPASNTSVGDGTWGGAYWDCHTSSRPCSAPPPHPMTAFSAVGWYFGRDLHDLLNGTVPLGLIGDNWGAAFYVEPGDEPLTHAPFAHRRRTPIEVWSDAETLARCPANDPVDPTTASTMYNAIMVPYIAYPGPLAVQGWIWYQGACGGGARRVCRLLRSCCWCTS